MCRALAALLCLAAPAVAQEQLADETLTALEHAVEATQVDVANTRWRAGGRLAWDLLRHGHENRKSDGGDLSAAALRLRGDSGCASFQVAVDLIGDDTRRHLYEAWAAVDLDDALRLSAGQLRSALTSEYATLEQDLPLPGFGFPAHLSGRHDLAARADGRLLDERLWYELTATGGNGFGLEGERRDARRISLRVAGHVLRGLVDGDGPLQDAANGFFVGLALAEEDDFDDPLIVSTPLESTTFRTGDLGGDSGSWAAVELGWAHGPWRVAVTRVEGEAENVPVAVGTVDADQLTAFSWTAAWALSGERYAWRAGRRITLPSAPDDHGVLGLPGRWELAARYSNQDIDRELLVGRRTIPLAATQEGRTFTMALSWTPRPPLRVTLGWFNTIVDEDLHTLGTKRRDSSFVLRFELAF